MMQKKRILRQLKGGEEGVDIHTIPARNEGSPTWLQDAQDMMLDLKRLKCSNALTGKLYGLCKRTADESKITAA
jgi:hypothetical protein